MEVTEVYRLVKFLEPYIHLRSVHLAVVISQAKILEGKENL